MPRGVYIHSDMVGQGATDRAAAKAPRAEIRQPSVHYLESGGKRYAVYDANQVVSTDGRYEGFRDDHIRRGGDNQMPLDRVKRTRTE